MRELTGLRGRVAEWRNLEHRLRDALELAALGDESMLAELEKETADIEAEVARLDLEALLSEPYDETDAFLSIHAGAGGKALSRRRFAKARSRLRQRARPGSARRSTG